MVHRDLKPDNVMLVPDADVIGGERAKVLDFGIAKLAAEHKHPDTGSKKTSTGTTLGTAMYMSPEQCRGDREINDRTDVYALGVIMYEMLTGKPPFDSEGWGALVAMHIYEKPRPLSEVDAEIDPTLAALVHRLLEKDPGARPAMSELVEQLDVLILNLGSVSMKLPTPVKAAPTSASASGSEHTTMRGANGQTEVVRPPPDARLRLALLLGGAVAATAGIWLAAGHRTPSAVPVVSAPGTTAPALTAATGVAATGALPPPSATPPPTPAVAPPAPAAAPVRWSITSVPANAEVLSATDHRVVGVTPWQLEQAPGNGKVSYVLHANGFADREIELDRSSSSAINQVLAPLRGSEKTSSGKSKRPGRGAAAAAGSAPSAAAPATPPAVEAKAVAPPAAPPPAAAAPEPPKNPPKSKAHPEKSEKAADDEFLP